jgi:hypothetical protein
MLHSTRIAGRSSWRSLVTYTLLLSYLVLFGWSKTSQITIDDNGADPVTGEQFVYAPLTDGTGSVWQVGQNCNSCRTQATVDRSKLYNNSWHDTTSNRPGAASSSASISFTGTAVWVQAIIPGSGHTELVGVDAEYYFFINNTQVGMYIEPAPSIGGDGYNYNTTIYSDTSLPWGKHNLTIRAGHNGGPEILMLLDSVIYTYDDGADKASSTDSDEHPPAKKKWIIIAAAVPTVIGVLAIIGVAYCLRRKYQRRHVITIGSSSDVVYTGPQGLPTSMTATPQTHSGATGSGSTFSLGTGQPVHERGYSYGQGGGRPWGPPSAPGYLPNPHYPHSISPPSSDNGSSSAAGAQPWVTRVDAHDELPPPAYGTQTQQSYIPAAPVRREKRG